MTRRMLVAVVLALMAACAGDGADPEDAPTTTTTTAASGATMTTSGSRPGLPADRDAAIQVLSRTAEPPDDLARFASTVFHLPGAEHLGPYPDGPSMVRGPARPLTESEAVTSIRTHYGAAEAEAERAVAVFERTDAREMIPHPKLRAAFAGLVGTVFEPAIDFFLTSGRFATVEAAETAGTDLPPALGTSTEGPGGLRMIGIDAGFLSEATFPQAIAVIGHQINHDDFTGGPSEEGVLGILTAIAHLQVLARDPGLADEPTPMARLNNTQALAFLNSREPGSAETAILTDVPTLFPGGDAAYERIGYWRLLVDDPFPGPVAVSAELAPVLRTELSAIVDDATALPETLVFSEELAAMLDEGLDLDRAGLTPAVRVGLELALGLVTVEEISTITGWSHDDAVAFDLDG